MEATNPNPWRAHLQKGQVIPACPLTLHENGTWSERHQTAVVRYYMDAGAGGLAVGVHSTQFAIREPRYGLFRPILELAAQAITSWIEPNRPFIRIAGLCGDTAQAVAEAETAVSLGYHAGLASLSAFRNRSDEDALAHCRRLAETIPIIGFYLQPAVGGRVFPYRFWRGFAEIPNVLAIKIAPFNRYQTWDVVRAVIESGRKDVALYTGNDDNIIADLLTPFSWQGQTRFIAGGLLGQWGVWTRQAVALLNAIRPLQGVESLPADWLRRNAALTDANAAVFDAANGFAGCIPGILEVLRRQGLAPSIRCLDPHEVLSPGQAEELDRVTAAYPELTDDAFVRENLQRWLP